MNRVDRAIARSLSIEEAKKPNPYRVEFDEKKHRWVTISGTRIMVNKKSGDAVGGPAAVVAHDTEDDKGATPESAKAHVDEILGSDNDFDTREGKDGNTEFGHPGTDKYVPLKGPGLFDTLVTMTSYVDVLTAATMKATGALAKRLDRSLRQLVDALQEFSGG